MSQRKIAEVLGVSKATVDRDLGGPNEPLDNQEGSGAAESQASSGPNEPLNDNPEIQYEEVDPIDPETYRVSKETGEILGNDRCDLRSIRNCRAMGAIGGKMII